MRYKYHITSFSILYVEAEKSLIYFPFTFVAPSHSPSMRQGDVMQKRKGTVDNCLYRLTSEKKDGVEEWIRNKDRLKAWRKDEEE